MSAANLQDAIRAYTAARMYSAATTDRWLRLDPGDADALLQLAAELRLGENQLHDLWEWAEEIAERDGLKVHQVLAAEPIAAVRRRDRGRNDKLKALKAALRRRRFPQLVAAEDRLADLIRALQLPRTVRVHLPDDLEGDQVRIEILAASPDEWRAAATTLRAAADSAACADIFALLDGELVTRESDD